MPSPPASHALHTLRALLASPPPLTHVHAPLSLPLFAAWSHTLFRAALGDQGGDWLPLSALEHNDDRLLWAAVARWLAPHPHHTAPPWTALLHAINSLPTPPHPPKLLLIHRPERLPPAALLALSRIGETSAGRLAHIYDAYCHTVVATFSPAYSTCPLALARLALARWAWFVGPVLREWEVQLRAQRDEHALSAEPGASPDDPWTEEARISNDGLPFQLRSDELLKLIRHTFTPEFRLLVQRGLPLRAPAPGAHVPALRNAADWLRATDPFSPSKPRPAAVQAQAQAQEQGTLSALAKWLLLAAFLCSENPARTDMRLFARLADGKRKKRRGGVRATAPTRGRKALTGEAREKIPQRLLGPSTFPLERLLAVLGSLLSEHSPRRFSAEGKGALDALLSRALLGSTLAELVERRLLVRVGGGGGGAEGRVDTVVLRCGVGYERARAVGRELRVRVEDLLWDRNA
ncbi:hypothetical protein CALCODRAFT_509953 [Calocera cornea HHB12733]|uniref:Origin recognition complex subunit 5 C-terminal domain-containing protein n=1 Tax=Calocera cornea HHB12733 TaxID=1353952 RepID=A0A165EWY5_9BASI|nr:hypothetical protein CALCODRAFT_509953 [Calocera cornea HHB12733]